MSSAQPKAVRRSNTASEAVPVRVLLWPSSSRVEYTNVPPVVEHSFRAAFPELEIVVSRSEEQFQRNLARCEILVTMSLHPEQFILCRELRWIHSPMAGVTQLMFPELALSPVIVTNGRTVHALPVAEHVFALMLALARQLPNCFRYQDQSQWGQDESWGSGQVPFELFGKVLGIVGFGTIGRELALRARAFGMRVVAIKRNPDIGGELAQRVYPPHRLGELLAESDFVVLAAPQTPETVHMIGKAELESMKPEACLVNAARGSLVDTGALLKALQARQIRAAALDVTDPEPLPSGHPLWKLPNVLIPPHLGGASALFWERESVLLRENLQRYLAGESLLNVVDKSRGY